MIKTLAAKDMSPMDWQNWIQGAVAPRPIAFASTQDAAGNVNLSPFSFFNVFGTNPPVLIFSPARRIRDNTVKHTLLNVQQVPEVVINIGSFSIVDQMSLASTEYPAGENEFIKAGLSPTVSVLIRPPRVQEAPVAFECKVSEVKPIGSQNGAANLVICEVLLMHIQEKILNQEATAIDPKKLLAVARMGSDWYCRAGAESLFRLPKPSNRPGMGFDQLPAFIRRSTVLNNSELARLANLDNLPTPAEINDTRQDPIVQYLLAKYAVNPEKRQVALAQLAKKLINLNHTQKAFRVLFISH